MAFLEIDGHEVDVLHATPVRTLARIGKRRRSFRGQSRDPRRNLRRQWKIETRHLTYAEGDALINLAIGKGHHFDWTDGIQASTGLKPADGYTGFHLDVAGAGPFGATLGRLSFDATTGDALTFDAQLPDDDYTIVWWEGGPPGSLYARRADGAGFDGATPDGTVGLPGGPSSMEVDVTDGVVTFRKPAAGAFFLFDVMLLPWRATDAMIASWDAITTRVGGLPVVVATGDMTDGAVDSVGELEGASFVGGAFIDGAQHDNAMLVTLRLLEVDEAFVRPAVA